MHLLLSAAILAVLTTAAYAHDMTCSTREDVLSQLGAKYQEGPTAQGPISSGGLFQILTSPDGSTWTAIVISPDGKHACLVAAGEDWQGNLVKPAIGQGL